MFTAAVHVPGAIDPRAVEALADSLSALVAGVAAGIVGDAVIVSADPTDREIALVAESTGAAAAARGRDPWAAAAALARRPWLLCLEAGDVPAEGWIRALDRFGATAPPGTLGRLARPHAPLLDRLAARCEALTGTHRVRAGDVVRVEALLAGRPGGRRLPVRPLRARLSRG
ncbi:hypothetical protein OPKNFCMD_3093 [Methylobacterium crusticola]|uniref:Glycosyltransferase n=1 Tax=Methylobacterium crusticola TaxID=1697972 RepID=A0ABQ4QYT9_9HYPH|nr:hypothetical protein [Methylobacterium crusticola]GJD50354.1 hypothetical protein OPKNFCMD_3093 [Methylobacterium crusticola]